MTTPSPQTPPLFTAKRIAPFAGILVIAALGFYFLQDVLNFERLAENREVLLEWRDGNYALVAAVYMLTYIAVVSFSLPGAAIMSLSGGFLFGAFPGVLFSVSAATMGATLIFSAARLGFGEALSAKIDGSQGAVKKMKDGLKEDEISYLLIMRLVPFVPFFVGNLIPALVGVSLGRFVATTFFGIIPGGLVFAWVGSGLGEIFALGEAPNLGIILEWSILGPLLGLAALALLPVVYKKIKKSEA